MSRRKTLLYCTSCRDEQAKAVFLWIEDHEFKYLCWDCFLTKDSNKGVEIQPLEVAA